MDGGGGKNGLGRGTTSAERGPAFAEGYGEAGCGMNGKNNGRQGGVNNENSSAAMRKSHVSRAK